VRVFGDASVTSPDNLGAIRCYAVALGGVGVYASRQTPAAWPDEKRRVTSSAKAFGEEIRKRCPARAGQRFTVASVGFDKADTRAEGGDTLLGLVHQGLTDADIEFRDQTQLGWLIDFLKGREGRVAAKELDDLLKVRGVDVILRATAARIEGRKVSVRFTTQTPLGACALSHDIDDIELRPPMPRHPTAFSRRSAI